MNRPMTWTALFVTSLFAFSPSLRAADAGFALDDHPGQYLDVLLDGKIVARYMDGHDTSTPEKRADTYKPYLHVFDAEGKAPITQGAGGKLFPHHRGIFIGWMKIGVTGYDKTFDRWHMKGGDIVHQKFIDQKAGPDSATFTSVTHWDADTPDKAIIEEERTMAFHRAPAPARVIIDFTSKLKAPIGDVTLDGDPEHSGIHYRPAGDVSTKETLYFFPKEGADAKKDVDFPWVGETYTLTGKRYSIVEMSDPKNPTGTKWSAYRDYGRFGAFPKAKIKSGESLTLKYRFVITDGEMLPAAWIEKNYDEFTGATAPTQVPPLFQKLSDQPKPKDPAAAVKPKAPAVK